MAEFITNDSNRSVTFKLSDDDEVALYSSSDELYNPGS
jgi:hypothetical protein